MEVEVSDLDLRYERCRQRDRKKEERLLLSILNGGVRTPLRGVGGKSSKVLLDGFKRLRCAKKLNIRIVPYVSIADERATGIMELIRGAFDKGLNVLEQSELISELKNTEGLSDGEIADHLGKSKAWVSLRASMTDNVSRRVLKRILEGKFPARSYLYTIAPLTRVNKLTEEQVDHFVDLVSGRKLSTRDLDLLAKAYFSGAEEIAEQLENGNLAWSLERLKDRRRQGAGGCSQPANSILKHLNSLYQVMDKLIVESRAPGAWNEGFLVQADILVEGVRKRMEKLSNALGRFHDRAR